MHHWKTLQNKALLVWPSDLSPFPAVIFGGQDINHSSEMFRPEKMVHFAPKPRGLSGA